MVYLHIPYYYFYSILLSFLEFGHYELLLDGKICVNMSLFVVVTARF